jgi:hypothetical protein
MTRRDNPHHNHSRGRSGNPQPRHRRASGHEKIPVTVDKVTRGLLHSVEIEPFSTSVRCCRRQWASWVNICRTWA